MPLATECQSYHNQFSRYSCGPERPDGRRGLPVIAVGKLIGIVTMTDVVRVFVRVLQATEQIIDG